MRKTFSLILALIMVLGVFCACKPQQNEKTSSTSAITETSSAMAESENSSKNNQNTASVSSKNEETSSEASSKGFDRNSSKKQNVSREETSSENIPISTSSKNNGTTTTSSSVKVNIERDTTLEIGAYHFNPKWTKNYGEQTEKKLEEFEDVLKSGYFNTVILEVEHFDDEEVWQILDKYDVTVWLCIWTYYGSTNQNMEDFMERYDVQLKKIRQNPERWARFNGFCFDESVWRGQSNENFQYECQYLYVKYGKRLFPVLSLGEFTELMGEGQNTIVTESFKYVTDVGFDSYSIDVRTGAPNGNSINNANQYFPKIKDGKTYYQEITKHMLKLVNHPVNVWFYPTAFTVNLSGGLDGLTRADEDFCMAHLSFFVELLEKQEYQGGIMLYTYTQFRDEELGMQSTLVVKDESGNQKLRPEQKNKWIYYSSLLKTITQKFRATKSNALVDVSKL